MQIDCQSGYEAAVAEAQELLGSLTGTAEEQRLADLSQAIDIWENGAPTLWDVDA